MTLTYKPPKELGHVAFNDQLEVLDRLCGVISVVSVVHVGQRHVRTSCGRKWTLDHGHWISEFRGGRPVSYPFPSVRKAKSRAASTRGVK